MQSQESVDSFGWQWTQRTVIDSTRTFHRRLFRDCGIWSNYLDNKVVADVCSGNGRHVWALHKLTKAKTIISVELAQAAALHQARLFKDVDKIIVINGDAAEIKFEADFIYMLGAIQHVADPKRVLKNIVENLRDQGELVVSFYMVTLATLVLEPIRYFAKRVPKRMLWWSSIFLAPLFMARRTGREMGFRNARHTAYDWFGSHEFQRYFTETEILSLFRAVGIQDTNIICLQKGLYKIRRGEGAKVDDTVHVFGGAFPDLN